MRNDVDFLKARVQYVCGPYVQGMLFHCFTFWNWRTCLGVGIEVWIHYKDWIAFRVSPIELWKHRAKLEALIDAYRSRPLASSYFAVTLDENQCRLASIGLSIAAVELPGHEYVAFRRLTTACSMHVLIFWESNLLEPIDLNHCFLYMLNCKLLQQRKLLRIFYGVKSHSDIVSLSDFTILQRQVGILRRLMVEGVICASYFFFHMEPDLLCSAAFTLFEYSSLQRWSIQALAASFIGAGCLLP